MFTHTWVHTHTHTHTHSPTPARDLARMKASSPGGLDISRSVSPATRMMESGGTVDWSYATSELLQKTGKNITEEKCVRV